MADEDGIFGPAYNACYQALLKEYITSTALCSMVACFLMGGWANLPLILAPGMGMNAYFTYGVVGKKLFFLARVLCARIYMKNLNTFRGGPLFTLFVISTQDSAVPETLASNLPSRRL